MIVRVATHAMGTRFEFVLSGDDPDRLHAVGEAALAEVNDWDERLSLFSPSSFVSYINANAASRPVDLDDEVYELIAQCLDVNRASNGAFDVTVAPLMRAWGFHEFHGKVTAAREAVGMDGIDLDPDRRTIRFLREGMAIDLGGVGKGHALDAARGVLDECGVDCALLHGGTSTVIALGAPDDGDGWRVALRTGGPSPIVTLSDAALSVSAQHGRTIEVDGARLGHIIDPTSGAPATGTHLAAVIAPGSRLADAWSTALLVLGDRPPGLSDDITTLIGCEEDGEDEHSFSIGGARPEFFSLPDRRGSAIEVML